MKLRILLALVASLFLPSCRKTTLVDVKQAGISLRYDSRDFAAPSIMQQPRLTAEENGTDVPVAVGPAHMVVSFDKESRSYISFVPLEDNSVSDYAKAYPQADKAAMELRKTFKDRPAEFSPGVQLPDLSAVDEEQELHAKVRYIDLPQLSGVAFLVQYTQEDHGDPVNNEELRYVFQGITKDGRYYIDARFKIAHPSLPQGVQETNNIARDDGNQYLRRGEKDLEALPDDSFKPSITGLNRLLASIAVSPVTSR